MSFIKDLLKWGAVRAVTNNLTGGIAGLSISGRTMYKSRAPADIMDDAVQLSALTAAISTTAALSAVASTTVYRARVVWVNNGASASAQLYISANCLNAVEGLAATQNAKRRDATITIGDAILLISDTPITRLDFSSDTAVTSATHSLQVTWGN